MNLTQESTFASTATIKSSGTIENCKINVPVEIYPLSASQSVEIKDSTFENTVSIKQLVEGLNIQNSTFKDAVTVASTNIFGKDCVFEDSVSIANNSNIQNVALTLKSAYAFCKEVDDNLVVQNAVAVTTLSDVVTKEHSHTVSSATGLCACGYECPHTNHSDDGVCPDCGYQYSVKVDSSSAITYCKSFENALDAAKDGDTLILLANVTISGEKRIGDSITLDLNGKSIYGDAMLYFHNDLKFTTVVIKNSASTVGTIKVCVETWCANMSVTGKVSFENDVYIDSNLTVSGGTNSFDNLIVQGVGNTASFSDIFYVTGTLTLKNTTTTINASCNVEKIVIGDCENRECSLSISGARVMSLTLKKCAILVKLAEGYYNSIKLDGTSLAYKDLLADKQAYTVDSESNFVAPTAISSNTTGVQVHLCSNHSWSDGVCAFCLKVCAHPSWNDEYKCTVCGKDCEHEHWTNGICDACEKVCSHEGGHATCSHIANCTICGEPYGEYDLNEHHLVLQQAVAATTTERGHITFYLCEDCGRCFADVLGMNEIAYEDTFTPMLAPSIVEGANVEYVRESGSALVFKSNADSKDFIDVFVDGLIIGEENYEKLEGGLIIGLKTEYLDTLSNGTHTLSIVSAGGEATTTFTVETVPEEGLSGGAWAGIGIAIAVGVIGAMFGIMFIFKKRG